MSIKERLKNFIKHEGISVASLERGIGVSNGYVNGVKKTIGADKSMAINRLYPNLNMDWLLTGKGEMISVSEKKEPKEKEFSDLGIEDKLNKIFEAINLINKRLEGLEELKEKVDSNDERVGRDLFNFNMATQQVIKEMSEKVSELKNLG